MGIRVRFTNFYEDVNLVLCYSVMGFEKGHGSTTDMVKRKRARHSSEREVGMLDISNYATK